MHIIRGIAVAFSTYSKIPMPQFVWKEEDMRYSMCFFPWIGAVIGAILWGWFRLSALLGISTLAFILISAALPLIITGIYTSGLSECAGGQRGIYRHRQ